MVHRVHLKWIGIVAAEHDLTDPDLGHQVPDRLGCENHRIEINLFEVIRRLLLELDLRIAALWTGKTAMVRTIGVGRQVTAAMGGDHLKLRRALEWLSSPRVLRARVGTPRMHRRVSRAEGRSNRP